MVPLRPRNRGAPWPPSGGVSGGRSLSQRSFLLLYAPARRCRRTRATTAAWAVKPARSSGPSTPPRSRMPYLTGSGRPPLSLLGLSHRRILPGDHPPLCASCLLEVFASLQIPARRKCVFLNPVTTKISKARLFFFNLRLKKKIL